MLDRVSQLALVAAAEAIAQSGALAGLAPERAACSSAPAWAASQTPTRDTDALRREFGPPEADERADGDGERAGRVDRHRARPHRPNLTYSTACSSSAVAIGEAAKRIARGRVDVDDRRGAEAPLTFGTMKAWDALKTLATRMPRSVGLVQAFLARRSGLVLGEGAAVLVLESAGRARAAGARMLAEIAGYGLCTDASHITRPRSRARRARCASRSRTRGSLPRVGYINAHGTGTQANDAVETAAIRQVLRRRAHRRPGELDQVDARSPAGGGRGAGAGRGGDGDASRDPAAHHATSREPDPECDLDYVPLGRAAVQRPAR
jgi:3-oxoacyl-[acyl-carrier-protein] synthase II